MAGQASAVLVTGPDLEREALDMLGAYEVIFAGPAPTQADLLALCQHNDPVAIIVRYGRVDKALMDAAPSLRVIAKHGTGLDSIDVAEARGRGIDVLAAAGANAQAVAEQALAMLLACAKSVVLLDRRMRDGHWDKATHKSAELHGKTLGIIGLGQIGRRLARMAESIGMKVLAFDPQVSKFPDSVEPATLDEIWSCCDAISLHCPLTAKTRSLICAETLGKCRKGVILVNTARGGLVNEEDLLQALRSGQVGSAGLDSFVVEPATLANPLLQEPRVVLSPHVGGLTHEAYASMGRAAARNVLSALRRSNEEAVD